MMEKRQMSRTAMFVYELLGGVLQTLIPILIVFLCFARIVTVDGESMLPTFENADRILVTSHPFYQPEHGDIVVLRKSSYGEQPIVKRVIATEGETVYIDFLNGDVYVDGIILDESYILEKTYLPGDLEFPFTVREGCVFVMGDNRNDSTDSRNICLGEIDHRYIFGKAMFILYPFDRLGGVER